MLNLKLDKIEGIAVLEPDGALSENDFISVAKEIDPYIESNGELRGIVIHAESFPGWDSFSALVAHLQFVREHHKKVSRIAIATDSPIGTLAEHVASHFVNAEIKNFKFGELAASSEWVKSGDD